jgi:ketosteroid isomerase-like protein
LSDREVNKVLMRNTFGLPLPEENVQIVRRVFDAFVRRDVEAALEVMGDEVEFSAPATQALVEKQASYQGHDGIREYFEDVGRVWDELDVFLREYHEVGDDRILVVGRVRGRGKARKIVDEPAQWAWRIEDEKIVWGHVFSNRDEAVRSIGLVEQAS